MQSLLMLGSGRIYLVIVHNSSLILSCIKLGMLLVNFRIIHLRKMRNLASEMLT